MLAARIRETEDTVRVDGYQDSGRALEDGLAVTDWGHSADSRREPLIFFAEAPLPGNSSVWRAQETAENHRFSQQKKNEDFAENRSFSGSAFSQAGGLPGFGPKLGNNGRSVASPGRNTAKKIPKNGKNGPEKWSGKSNWGLSKWGLKALVQNCAPICREKQRGVENSGVGKTCHKTPP